jgi:hypothetical protein
LKTGRLLRGATEASSTSSMTASFHPTGTIRVSPPFSRTRWSSRSWTCSAMSAG